jgi:hypothetical protein
MEKLEVLRNGRTNEFSVVLSRGNDTIRCMVSVDAGMGHDERPDAEWQRAALLKAKALARALDDAIDDE